MVKLCVFDLDGTLLNTLGNIAGHMNRTLEEFSQDYALTEEGLVFYTQPFQMSNKNASRYRIPVALSDLAALLD